MGDTTKISWADATFNGWIGCTKIADECKFCYAERDNNFHKWNGGLWGPGSLRKITSESNWQKPLRWNREAQEAGVRKRAFAFSLADVFDKEGPLWPHDRRTPGYNKKWPLPVYGPNLTARQVFFYHLVLHTQFIDWLVLTKRFEEAADFWFELQGNANHDGDPSRWQNLWLIFSAGNQENLDKAMVQMKRIRPVVRGISAEPLLGPMDFTPYLDDLDWVIIGAESGNEARLPHLKWFRDIRDQVHAAGKALFVKQTGKRYVDTVNGVNVVKTTADIAGRDLTEWPDDIRIQEYPNVLSAA
jgi:protein gp37